MNLNSGMRQTLTSLEALEASKAMNPAYLPINLTNPTPNSAQWDSIYADLIAF